MMKSSSICFNHAMTHTLFLQDSNCRIWLYGQLIWGDATLSAYPFRVNKLYHLAVLRKDHKLIKLKVINDLQKGYRKGKSPAQGRGYQQKVWIKQSALKSKQINTEHIFRQPPQVGNMKGHYSQLLLHLSKRKLSSLSLNDWSFVLTCLISSSR